MNSAGSLEEVIQLVIQELSMKHEATDALASWQFTSYSIICVMNLKDDIKIFANLDDAKADI